MFYFDNFNGKRVLRSDYLNGVNAFFTTRDGFDFTSLGVNRVVTPNQTHTNNVQVVDEKIEYPECDGLITNRINEAVYLRFADCTPLIFYDLKHNTGAVTHAGWRGTYQKIAQITIEKMETNFGTKPEDLTVLIGPAISICCYEVGEDVKEKLLSTVNNKSGLYEGSKIDLKQINARQLEEAGVRKIDICPYCTSCNNDLFFSYRKEQGTKDRHYAVLML